MKNTLFGETVEFIRDSIEKGSQTVSRMLNEAKNESLNALKKIGKAILTALESAKEFIEWLSKKTIKTFIDMCQGLPDKLLEKIFETIKTNIKKFEKLFEDVVKELKNIATELGLKILNVILSVWGKFRKLTAGERANVKKIFGNSIQSSRVRISQYHAALKALDTLVEKIFGENVRPFTIGYRIYVPSGNKLEMGTLIHELTHTWQYEQLYGANYVWKCLRSQISGKGYVVDDEHLKKADGQLENLECEQQAVVVERYWESEFNKNKIGIKKTTNISHNKYTRNITLHVSNVC